MKLLSAALALGAALSFSGAALAQCPGKNMASTAQPITTASTTVVTGDKG